MPALSRFLGIYIRMFYSDHDPARFHAIYSEYEALIEIDTLMVFGVRCRGGHSRWFYKCASRAERWYGTTVPTYAPTFLFEAGHHQKKNNTGFSPDQRDISRFSGTAFQPVLHRLPACVPT